MSHDGQVPISDRFRDCLDLVPLSCTSRRHGLRPALAYQSLYLSGLRLLVLLGSSSLYLPSSLPIPHSAMHNLGEHPFTILSSQLLKFPFQKFYFILFDIKSVISGVSSSSCFQCPLSSRYKHIILHSMPGVPPLTPLIASLLLFPFHPLLPLFKSFPHSSPSLTV